MEKEFNFDKLKTFPPPKEKKSKPRVFEIITWVKHCDYTLKYIFKTVDIKI